ncbi:TIGR02444 family protein [Shewanella sp. NIFS-20-20]|uniref:TIGR02444 family protein n=1 Tax=Shewanella sp. NIFS-20-20 TaxID=2853806 RepID=UPI001C47CF50|nr:TIGR02444 family protein [Shewanella sp. NIFS-20-20]MBV7316294.1 TIGR02444 family protein [Shewanella sp. NIFS-20-20]
MHSTKFNQTLWQRCDTLYEKLQPLCLELQDQHGVCVNLLLLAYYLDERAMGFNLQQWQQLHQQVSQWEEKLLLPYRRLRRLGKSHLSEDEYQQMLGLELRLERQSQRRILSQINEMNELNVGGNLGLYLSLFNLNQSQFSQLNITVAA